MRWLRWANSAVHAVTGAHTLPASVSGSSPALTTGCRQRDRRQVQVSRDNAQRSRAGDASSVSLGEKKKTVSGNPHSERATWPQLGHLVFPKIKIG